MLNTQVPVRNPHRIPVMLAILKFVWENNPDLRLSQLVLNCASEGDYEYAGLYNLEDKELAERMYKLYNIPKLLKELDKKNEGAE